jgi:hypothetical protein
MEEAEGVDRDSLLELLETGVSHSQNQMTGDSWSHTSNGESIDCPYPLVLN